MFNDLWSNVYFFFIGLKHNPVAYIWEIAVNEKEKLKKKHYKYKGYSKCSNCRQHIQNRI